MKWKALAILLLAEAVAGLFAGAWLYAYFCDVETSRGNMFSAGTWTVYGELLEFIVSKNVIRGQTANFTVVFKNCGAHADRFDVARHHCRKG